MSKTLRILDDFLDKSFVYSVLLNEAHIYYGRLKTLLKVPLIITSSVMTVVNGNIQDIEALKIANITLNILTVIILGIVAIFKIEEKHSNFAQAEKKFLKLSSKIGQNFLNDDEVINKDFIKDIMNEYDRIVENIDFDIPKYICVKTNKKYATLKTLPLILNGTKKDDNNRSFKISPMEYKTYSMDDKKSTTDTIIISPASPKLQPVVLNIKPHIIEKDVEANIQGLQL